MKYTHGPEQTQIPYSLVVKTERHRFITLPRWNTDPNNITLDLKDKLILTWIDIEDLFWG